VASSWATSPILAARRTIRSAPGTTTTSARGWDRRPSGLTGGRDTRRPDGRLTGKQERPFNLLELPIPEIANDRMERGPRHGSQRGTSNSGDPPGDLGAQDLLAFRDAVDPTHRGRNGAPSRSTRTSQRGAHARVAEGVGRRWQRREGA
jgi:hypothetical protein